jgi:hypothetical protein
MLYCTSRRRRQSGQIIPIAVVAFIVLAAIAGLAIDASHDYLIKRNAQNAADFSALAAAKAMTLSGNVSVAVSSGSAAVKAAHDFAANNGFSTLYSTACDNTAGGGFTTSWFDIAGVPCSATTGFRNKVSVNMPVQALSASPVPPVCQGTGKFSCVQVVITTNIAQLFANVLGISSAYVTVGASAHATLPGSAVNAPPPNALVLYQPQSGCDTNDQQCFNEANAVGRSLLSCSGGTNNCPTFWTTPGTKPQIYGYDGSTFTPALDMAAVQSNGDMVVQDRTTICDPYNGAVCAQNIITGAAGFAVPAGAKVYCQKYGGGAVFSTPCTTTGQPSLNELDSNQTPFSSAAYWSPSVDTTGLKSCGSLVLNGQAVSGPCSNVNEPYLIEPGFYSYIVINHGTYEFDPGLYDITDTAPVNTLTGGGYTANGIDHSREGGADFDLCTGGQPNSCPTLTAGVWIGHGGGAFGAYVKPVNQSCTGGASSSTSGGGDNTIISGSGVVFRLERNSGGFVVTNEVQGLVLAGAGVNALTSVGGSPLLIDEENDSFIHIDSRANNNNQLQGLIYQKSSATAGGVEVNLGLTSGGNVALTGQVLAYSFTTFGQPGSMDFSDGYGAGTVSSIPTSGKNEISIIQSASLTAAAPGYQTVTVHYTDEWAMDAYDQFIKVNNGQPVFFSQGIWTSVPGPGAPQPPPSNNPGDQFAAYPNSGLAGSYTVKSMNPPDWVYAIPNSNGATIEVSGNWTWGHESDISGANSGGDIATVKYTFPTPIGSYVSVSVFVLDGDHCGDYAYQSYTFKNTGQPGPGQQTIGGTDIVQ